MGDGTGKLDWDTFEKMVQSLGQTPTRNDLKDNIWNKQESCKSSGFCDRAAVEAMWGPITERKKSKQDVLNAFRVFDNRGNGFITDDQFNTMLRGGWAIDPEGV